MNNTPSELNHMFTFFFKIVLGLNIPEYAYNRVKLTIMALIVTGGSSAVGAASSNPHATFELPITHSIITAMDGIVTSSRVALHGQGVPKEKEDDMSDMWTGNRGPMGPPAHDFYMQASGQHSYVRRDQVNTSVDKDTIARTKLATHVRDVKRVADIVSAKVRMQSDEVIVEEELVEVERVRKAAVEASILEAKRFDARVKAEVERLRAIDRAAVEMAKAVALAIAVADKDFFDYADEVLRNV